MIQRNYYAYKEKSFLQRLTGHFCTVMTHKYHVWIACCKMGLYRQGLFHDMSKFSPIEFCLSVKYYSGTFSPNITDRVLNGASRSWLHHKGRNKHHFEYWTDYSIRQTPYIFGCRMPMKYVAEMVADRYAACVAYNRQEYSRGAAWEYYQQGRGKIIIHDDTRIVLENALYIMKVEGEKAAFDFMKGLMKKTRGMDYTAETLGLKEIEE